MNDAEEQVRREVALFRYGSIADLIHLPPGTPGIGDKLRAKAEQQYTIPGTLRTSVAAETLRVSKSSTRTASVPGSATSTRSRP